MGERSIPRVVVTALGATLAGLTAGAVGIVLESGFGAVLGVALAMPVFVQAGWGFGEFDRDSYFAEQEFEDVILDSGAMVTGATVVGGLAVVWAMALDVGTAAEIAIASGGAFGGGTAAFLWQTDHYR